MSSFKACLAEICKLKWRTRREQAQATVNCLYALRRQYVNIQSQLNFLLQSKNRNLIPKGFKQDFSHILGYSGYIYSFRFSLRTSRKLLKKSISISHQQLKSCNDKLEFISNKLLSFRLGSRFHSNLEKTLSKKAKHWKSQYNTIHSNTLFLLSHEKNKTTRSRLLKLKESIMQNKFVSVKSFLS